MDEALRPTWGFYNRFTGERSGHGGFNAVGFIVLKNLLDQPDNHDNYQDYQYYSYPHPGLENIADQLTSGQGEH